MIFLLLSVITSTFLIVILKLFSRFNIDTFQAIVFNYWVCTLTGGMMENYSTLNNVQTIAERGWFLPACILGMFFIGLFNLMGWTAQKVGITAVSVSNKLSLVIPVSIAIIFFHEPIHLTKIIAMVLAIGAVFLVTYQKSDEEHKISPLFFLLPVVLFLGSGFNDSLVNYVQKKMLPTNESGQFVIWIFQIAAILGTIIMIGLLLTKKKTWSWKNLAAGVCLGIPNYFSMYYLLKSLSDSGLQSSEVFPINNVAIVIFSSVIGIFFFKEKLSKLQLSGILLACISIFLLMQ